MDVKNKFNRSQTIAPPLESLVETNLMAVCREKSDHGSLGPCDRIRSAIGRGFSILN